MFFLYDETFFGLIKGIAPTEFSVRAIFICVMEVYLYFIVFNFDSLYKQINHLLCFFA